MYLTVKGTSVLPPNPQRDNLINRSFKAVSDIKATWNTAFVLRFIC